MFLFNQKFICFLAICIPIFFPYSAQAEPRDKDPNGQEYRIVGVTPHLTGGRILFQEDGADEVGYSAANLWCSNAFGPFARMGWVEDAIRTPGISELIPSAAWIIASNTSIVADFDTPEFFVVDPLANILFTEVLISTASFGATCRNHTGNVTDEDGAIISQIGTFSIASCDPNVNQIPIACATPGGR